MEFYPPINEIKTKELLNIVSNDEKWTREIQLLAEEELYRRKFTKETIAEEKNKRIKIIQKYRRRETELLERNKVESYSATEMISIIAFFPFSLFLHLNPLAEFWELDAGNYKKKIWQRVILIIVSIFLWIQIVRLIVL